MCGPLACALRVKPVEYHAGRIVSYAVAGALCGGLGQLVSRGLNARAVQAAPWILVGVFVAMACGFERRMPLPAFLLKSSARLRLDRNLGWLTPLLPCGPLWLMLGAAVGTGSVLSGGMLLFWFALGTVCLYGIVQAGVFRLQRVASPLTARRMQSGLLWGATAVLGWRLWNGGSHGCCAL